MYREFLACGRGHGYGRRLGRIAEDFFNAVLFGKGHL